MISKYTKNSSSNSIKNNIVSHKDISVMGNHIQSDYYKHLKKAPKSHRQQYNIPTLPTLAYDVSRDPLVLLASKVLPNKNSLHQLRLKQKAVS